MPKISVLLPTYIRAGFLRECITSVLDQSFSDYELVIIDDGSTDHTKDILKEFCGRFKYIYQPNSGISAARNRCLAESSAPLVSFIDSDDVWCKDKLALQYAFLEDHPEKDIVFSDYENFLDGADLTSENLRRELNFHSKKLMASALIKRSLFERFGNFAVDLKTGEDSEWVMRIALHGVDTGCCIDSLGYYRRLHSSNSILSKTTTTKDVLRVLARSVRKNFKKGE